MEPRSATRPNCNSRPTQPQKCCCSTSPEAPSLPDRAGKQGLHDDAAAQLDRAVLPVSHLRGGIDAENVIKRRADVIGCVGWGRGESADLVGAADDLTGTNTSTGEDTGEAGRPVVATSAADLRRPAKLTHHQD